MQKNQKPDRVVKDLSFLLQLKQQEILTNSIYKYQLEKGDGQLLENITLPCSIYLTYFLYDYEGRVNRHIINIAIKYPSAADQNIPKGVLIAMKTMKVGQKSWFNIKNQELHQVSGLQYDGCHFEVTINDIKYKNSDSIESKRKIQERNREDGKKLYHQQRYEDAIKKYSKIINITEGLQKGKYSQQELKEIDQMNLKAKQNYLRCLCKTSYDSYDQGLSNLAKSYSQTLLQKRQRNALSLYLRSRVLFLLKYLDDSLEVAQQARKVEDNQSIRKLIKQIKAKLSK